MYLSDIIRIAGDDPLLTQCIQKVEHDYLKENLSDWDTYQRYCIDVMTLYADTSARRYIKSIEKD